MGIFSTRIVDAVLLVAGSVGVVQSILSTDKTYGDNIILGVSLLAILYALLDAFRHFFFYKDTPITISKSHIILCDVHGDGSDVKYLREDELYVNGKGVRAVRRAYNAGAGKCGLEDGDTQLSLNVESGDNVPYTVKKLASNDKEVSLLLMLDKPITFSALDFFRWLGHFPKKYNVRMEGRMLNTFEGNSEYWVSKFGSTRVKQVVIDVIFPSEQKPQECFATSFKAGTVSYIESITQSDLSVISKVLSNPGDTRYSIFSFRLGNGSLHDSEVRVNWER